MTPPLTPLALVQKAEAQAAEAIREGARLIDGRAGSQLPAALAELAAACGRAKERVAEAQRTARDLVAGLLGAFDALTVETMEGVEHARQSAPPSAPAPEAPPRAPEPALAEAAEGPAAPAVYKAPAGKGPARAVSCGGPKRRKSSPLTSAGPLPGRPGRHAAGEAPRRSPAAREGGAAVRRQGRAGGEE